MSGSERKLFTAEIQRMKAMAQKGEAGASAFGGASNSEVLKAIEDLRKDIKVVECLIKGEEAPPPTAQQVSEDEVIMQKQAEVSMLKTELRALAICIEHTKMEIAALRPKDSTDDRLMAVTFELDAIVSSTEGATESILEAAEKIDNLAAEVRSHVSDAYVTGVLDDMAEITVSIFEACNFQDITGQRITKVVRTLKYIEERVNAMIEIWGPDNIAEIVPKAAEEFTPGDDTHLLNGPALENQGISQDDIDKLFG